MRTEILSKTVDVRGLRLHYLEAGSGPPVLLLHGWPTNAQLWRRSLPPLSASRRAIALDLPGFGLSDKPTDVRYSFRFFEETLTGFLDALGIELTGLVVHDLGGPVGLYWAACHLSRLSDLAILNTLAFPDTSWAVKLFVAATLVPGLRDYISSPRGVRAAMRFGVRDKSAITADVADLYAAPYEARDARRALLAAGHGLSPRGLVKIARTLPSIKVPVRLIYGDRDRILPDVARTMARIQALVPQAELSVLPGCGHFLQEDEGEEVGRMLAEFFGRERPS
jgi:pimeloyl-ACP methyl ester carboxylesterase